METFKHNKIIFNPAIFIAALSIFFFLVPHKTVRADGRPLSFYGISAGSVSNSANTVPVGGTSGVASLQYINGVYSNGGSYSGDSLYSNNSYSGSGTYSGSSYSGATYSGGAVYSQSNSSGNGVFSGDGSYSGGGLYSSVGSYSDNNNYSDVAYSGGSYSGGSSYGGSSQVAAVGAAFSKCEPYLKFYLGLGKNNNPDEVKKLQSFLNKYEGENLAVTGVFEQKTFDAVKKFQDKYAKDILRDSWGLSCNTGYVYITTLAKINDIVCKTNTDFANISLPNPRPTFFCNGGVGISPITNQPISCATPNSIISSASSSQDDSVAIPKLSLLTKAKNSWRKALGQ